MRELERLGQHVQRERGRLGVVLGVQARLEHLEVPVAQLAVDEAIQRPRRAMELERARSRRRPRPPRPADATGSTCPRPPRPRARQRARRRPTGTRNRIEPRRVEELVRELPALGDRALVEAHVLRRGHRQQPVADGVGAVGGEIAALGEHGRTRAAVDQRQRVDPGAERLRHPAPVRRLDDRVHVDVVERDVAGELEPHEDHPGDPQEQDVARRREHVGRDRRPSARRSGPASRASRTATARSRTTCRARPGRAPSPGPRAGPCRRRSRLPRYQTGI